MIKYEARLSIDGTTLSKISSYSLEGLEEQLGKLEKAESDLCEQAQNDIDDLTLEEAENIKKRRELKKIIKNI